MFKEKVILIGAGGHCRSVIDVIEAEDRFTIAGILDKKELLGKKVSGYEVIGTDEDLVSLVPEFKNFHITVGHIRSNTVRVKLFDLIRSAGGQLPSIFSPLAYVSKHATVGEGTVIMHKALVNAGAAIGNNCIINTGSVIEHDAVIGHHCHVSTGAYINGDCRVEDHCFVGSQATLVQGTRTGSGIIIAAGAVLTRHAETKGMYAGNPAVFKKEI